MVASRLGRLPPAQRAQSGTDRETGVEEEVELIEARIEVGDQDFGPVAARRRLDACSF